MVGPQPPAGTDGCVYYYYDVQAAQKAPKSQVFFELIYLVIAFALVASLTTPNFQCRQGPIPCPSEPFISLGNSGGARSFKRRRHGSPLCSRRVISSRESNREQACRLGRCIAHGVYLITNIVFYTGTSVSFTSSQCGTVQWFGTVSVVGRRPRCVHWRGANDMRGKGWAICAAQGAKFHVYCTM